MKKKKKKEKKKEILLIQTYDSCISKSGHSTSKPTY